VVANICKLFVCIWLVGFAQFNWAQPRKLAENEYQVWRSRVVSRLDLLNKVNKVLVDGLPKDGYVRTDRHERNQEGIIYALLQAYSLNKMPGYLPYRLEEYVTYEAVMQLTSTMVVVPTAPTTQEQDTADPFEDNVDFDADFLDDTAAEPMLEGPKLDLSDATTRSYLWMGYGTVLEIIYDVVFSSRTSAVEFVPLYLRLVLVTETEPYIDRPMVAFRYDDVAHILHNTFVYSPHDDAHPYNCHDFIMMRLYDSMDLNIRGNSPQSLLEADKRRDAIILYEHNLWSY
jgi:hypothetical protein